MLISLHLKFYSFSKNLSDKIVQIKVTIGTCTLNIHNTKFSLFLNFRKNIVLIFFFQPFMDYLFPFWYIYPTRESSGQGGEKSCRLSNPNNNCGFIPFAIETPVKVLTHWNEYADLHFKSDNANSFEIWIK